MSAISFKFSQNSLSRGDLNSLLQSCLFIQNRFKSIEVDITISKNDQYSPAYVALTFRAGLWFGSDGYVAALKIRSSVQELESHVDAILKVMSDECNNVLKQILDLNDLLPNELSLERIKADKNAASSQFPEAS